MRLILLFFLLFNHFYIDGQGYIPRTDSMFNYSGFSTNNTWDLKKATYFQYDSLARLTEKYWVNTSLGVINSINKTIYAYNSNNLLSETVTYNRNSLNNWYINDSIYYEYDSLNRIITETTEIPSLGNFRIIWQYDAKGNIISRKRQTGGGTTWYDITFRNYAYDSNNNLIFENRGNPGIGGPSDYEEYHSIYDSLNRKIRTIYYGTHYFSQHSGGSLVAMELDTFIYDHQHQLFQHQKFNRIFWNNGDWRPFLENSFQYNNGRITQHTRKQRFIDTLLYEYQISYSFNNLNQSVMESTRYWDTLSLSWMEGNNITFNYNNFDSLSQEIQLNWSDLTNDYTDKDYKVQYFWSNKTIVTTQETAKKNHNCLIPNPYFQGTTIRCLDWQTNKQYHIQVFNTNGQLQHQQRFMGLEGFRLLKKLNSNWYIFVIRNQQGSIVHRQIIWVL